MPMRVAGREVNRRIASFERDQLLVAHVGAEDRA